MIFSVAVFTAAAAEITAPQADITLDGTREAGFSTDYIVFGNDDVPGRAWVAWNENRLYMFVEVLDTTPNHYATGGNTNFFQQDGIEVNIWPAAGQGNARFSIPSYNHEATNEGPTWRNHAGTQLRSRADIPSIMEHMQWWNGGIDGDYANGYIIELAVNLTDLLGFEPELGTSFLIEIRVNDNVDGEARGPEITQALHRTITLGEAGEVTPYIPAETQDPIEQPSYTEANGAEADENGNNDDDEDDNNDNMVLFIIIGVGVVVVVVVAVVALKGKK